MVSITFTLNRPNCQSLLKHKGKTICSNINNKTLKQWQIFKVNNKTNLQVAKLKLKMVLTKSCQLPAELLTIWEIRGCKLSDTNTPCFCLLRNQTTIHAELRNVFFLHRSNLSNQILPHDFAKGKCVNRNKFYT